ncbi:Hypothetical predicted protein [Olea europaea subsp. europaea]|uniref:Uncharacterized protein n=1 Tax=Olea europaea subsp. europaea TaxID=158383 RepID=A0A8S0QA49_OLEEU|nr:Hypothetical predicted protein [Olea europaea subsp. europaea]
MNSGPESSSVTGGDRETTDFACLILYSFHAGKNCGKSFINTITSLVIDANQALKKQGLAGQSTITQQNRMLCERPDRLKLIRALGRE